MNLDGPFALDEVAKQLGCIAVLEATQLASKQRIERIGDQGHRTSNMVDRLMRWQDRFLFNRQYFHRSWEAVQLGIRAWAILRNFRPLCPRAIGKRTDGACAAERLNGFRYCDDWLENLRVSSSMCGYRQ